MSASIQLSELNLHYDGHCVLDRITHHFAPNQCHILMGPNGGGKTSVIRSILGLTPFKGDIKIDWGDSEPKLGYVPQKAVFEPSLPLTVEDFIQLNVTRTPLFWRNKSVNLKKGIEQLERVGMASRLKLRMGALSGGEQQRVMFAQALLDNPSLLILDEPTTGMDENGVRFLEDVIDDLIGEGKTVLAVHHDISAVRRIADVVHVVNRSIIDSGTVGEVLTSDKLERLFTHHSTFAEAL
ncbi:metal ABC transporter ATP-binding protein [Vibrio europaeus]|uniref:metal ABC transporter ATP-binding protein n=1 Tax=Vibrio europaeus TaxID=300876 RepID=UPI0018A7A588|nr:metal ABC transporter ATP-binding protein [Vibrio europaeus]MDC5811773.1 metal ABC transporter ATP-binding protein [Vibrio europaeus]QPG34309.1 metal ABC transporter ATP-binding protein [Vibrio europaeus]